MKSMNPMQNYPHIIQLLSRTLKIFAFMFLFPMNSLFFQKHIQRQTYQINNFRFLQNQAIQCVPTSA